MLQSSAGTSLQLMSATIGSDSVRNTFVGGSFNAWGARFSPSGNSVAYSSDESGRPEVYIRSFPGGGARVQVSAAGGSEPIWSPDGLHLYYAAGDQLTRATLTAEPNVAVVARDSLFSGPFFSSFFSQASYDVARDGRLLMTRPRDDHFQLVVTLNWTAALTARLEKR
jgi:eukaryotic-like serine/threonine-protein kinase